MDRLKFDWTINIAHLGAIFVSLITIVSLYFDIRLDMKEMRARSDLKYAEMEKVYALQREVDNQQDARVARMFAEITSQIRDLRQDLRNDIRDLRQETQKTNMVLGKTRQ